MTGTNPDGTAVPEGDEGGINTLETTYTDSNGSQHIITTTRSAGESIGDFIDRHFAEVTIVANQFP